MKNPVKNISSGVLLYRRNDNNRVIEVLLVHPGGPYFTTKDKGWWSIPKGLPGKDEDLLAAAKREFAEEIGFMPEGEFISLGEVKQKAGKTVHCWAVEADVPEGWVLKCNTFKVQWPPRSGKWQSFPEVDKAEFFTLSHALLYINEAQQAFIHRLCEKVDCGTQI